MLECQSGRTHCTTRLMFSNQRIHAAALLALLVMIVGVTDLRPILNDNEAVRLIPGVKLWDASEFDGDWSFQYLDPSSALFDRLVAALLHLGSPVLLALSARAVLFATLLYLVWRMADRVGTRADALFAGLCGWYFLGQTAVAGEWIVRGFEPKVFGYAFLLAAMLAHLERRRIAGAVFLALACIAHPFVGLWGGGSLVAALATERQRNGFLLSALTFAALLLLAGIMFLAAGPSDAGDLRLYVHFRNPHHLDPAEFGSRAQILLAFVTLGIVIAFRARAANWTLLDRWLFFVNLSFGVGLAAWVLDFTPLLATYPFRIAPVANLLAACVLVATWIFNRTWSGDWVRGVVLAAFALIFAARISDQIGDFTTAWEEWLTQTDLAHRPIVSWIRTNAGKDAVLLMPPDDAALWFYSGRPQFVSFKYHPPHAMREWLNRLKMLNGGKEFTRAGFGAAVDLRESYARLACDDLTALRQEYRVRYYVTTLRRDDLVSAEAFSDPPYRVYDLARLDAERQARSR
jgi:hypothetical protein